MEVTDDPGLTHSSDPTSEDVELRTSTYKEAMLLLEQLCVDHTGMFSSHRLQLLQVPLKTWFLCMHS